MGRARRLESHADFRRALKNGRGIGQSSSYKPWIRTQDVPNITFSDKIQGLTVDRVFHSLSPIEEELFYQLDFQNSVIDIREQFPILPIDLSLLVSHLLEIDHPIIPKVVGRPTTVMTTDFLVTRKSDNKLRLEAYCVKPIDALENIRTLEKVEVERVIWQLLGVHFHIYVGSKKGRIRAKNIKWFTDPLRHGFESHDVLEDKVCRSIAEGFASIEELTFVAMEKTGQDAIHAQNLIRTLFAKKKIKTDLDVDIVEQGCCYVRK